MADVPFRHCNVRNRSDPNNPDVDTVNTLSQLGTEHVSSTRLWGCWGFGVFSANDAATGDNARWALLVHTFPRACTTTSFCCTDPAPTPALATPASRLLQRSHV
jgi:hypothetical protein